jgi:2-succinyl-5-enolpyruvyl-6-hydroxy-3-cyclohexene-1-carboxylate synthase
VSGSARRPESAGIGGGPDIGCRNLQWSLALLEGLCAAGLRQLVLSPGARSTPLVIAAQRLEQAGRLAVTPVLDERSAAFFALGLARARLEPVALLATSGSAPAHWYPAVIEASQSRVPLLLLSADRPPRLRGWGANQTVDQLRLFGTFVREFHDPGLPQAGTAALKAQRALGRRAAGVAKGRDPGPVHLNLPFDEPLVPGPDCEPETAVRTRTVTGQRAVAQPHSGAGNAPPARTESVSAISSAGEPPIPTPASPSALRESPLTLAGWPPLALAGWPAGRGLIICGPGADRGLGETASSGDRGLLAAHRASLWRCAETLALPVLVDPLSGLRAGPGSTTRISGYDAILRNRHAAQTLRPDWVLRIGQAPVSKVLGQWLDGVPAILIDDAGGWSDPGHDAIARFEVPAAAVCEALVAQQAVVPDHEWLERWRSADHRAWEVVDAHAQFPIEDAGDHAQRAWCEAQILRTLRRSIPDGEALFCANSMPIRQLDTWWRAGGSDIALIGNRGASGIDGYLSTLAGLGAAGLHCWGLTGDLSFCHDLSALALAARLDRPVLVLNNDGGHIFDYLPQRDLPDFERLWQTPQPLAIGALSALAGLRHWQVDDGPALERALAEAGHRAGVIEARIDPERSRRSHRALWDHLAAAPLVDG